MKRLLVSTLVTLLCAPAALRAQQPVVGVKDADRLFTSSDPTLQANKQVAYHIVRDLIEAGHWELADQYLAPEYVQHNPNAKSGRDAVVYFFTKVLKVQPRPIPEHLGMKIVAVIAEGDLVTVMYPRTVHDATRPDGVYKTTWFDTWRIRDGKAVEHWDPALINEAPDLQ